VELMDYPAPSGIYNCKNCVEASPFLDGFCCYCEYPKKAKVSQIMGVWMLTLFTPSEPPVLPTDDDLSRIEDGLND